MSEFLESCHVCGHDIASEAESCRNCGAKASPTERLRQQAALLAELDREHNERMKREKEQESFWAFLIGAVFVGLLFLLFVAAAAASRR